MPQSHYPDTSTETLEFSRILQGIAALVKRYRLHLSLRDMLQTEPALSQMSVGSVPLVHELLIL